MRKLFAAHPVRTIQQQSCRFRAVQAAGADLALAALPLAEVEALSAGGVMLDVAGGLGVKIDESYNVNLASMSAARRFCAAALQGCRIAVLGDMAQLGEASKICIWISPDLWIRWISIWFSVAVCKWRTCLPICRLIAGAYTPFNRCADKYSSGGNSRRLRRGQRLACQPDESGCRCAPGAERVRINKGITRCCMN